CRQVEPLGARRRNDVGCIPRQEQAPVLHWLGHEAAEWRDAFFDGRSRRNALGGIRTEPAFQLFPEPVIRPVVEANVEWALDVVSATRRRAHAGECEPIAVTGIDELVRARLDIRQHTKPAEGIGSLVCGQHGGGDGRAAHAMEPVATGDEITFQNAVLLALPIADTRSGANYILDRSRLGFVECDAAVGFAGLHEISRYLSLAVDDDPAARQSREIDAQRAAVEIDLETAMPETFAGESLGPIGLLEEVDRAALRPGGRGP